MRSAVSLLFCLFLLLAATGVCPAAQAGSAPDAAPSRETGNSEQTASAGAPGGEGVSLRITATPADNAETEAALPQASPDTAASTQAATARPAVFSFGGYLRALGVLCLAVAALWLVMRFVRKYSKSFSHVRAGLDRSLLRMEAQLPLGPRRGLMVVRFGDERLLLGVTEQQITCLTTHMVDSPEAAEKPDAEKATPFAAVMKSFTRPQHRQSPEAEAPKTTGMVEAENV